MAFRIVLGHYVEALEERKGSETAGSRLAWLQRGYRRERWRLLTRYFVQALILRILVGVCVVGQLVLAFAALFIFVAILSVSIAASGLLQSLAGAVACFLMVSLTVVICRVLSLGQSRGLRISKNALHEFRRIRGAHLGAEDIKHLGELLVSRRSPV